MGIVRGKRLGLLHKVRIYEPMSLECSDNNVVTGKDKKRNNQQIEDTFYSWCEQTRAAFPYRFI